ncbi:MAG: T9SS type A sorting domain-containing protein [Bacteroidetes bacterium]|nr:T9SS type A sorting domain-containing protein [Bacteroidota bacterium]
MRMTSIILFALLTAMLLHTLPQSVQAQTATPKPESALSQPAASRSQPAEFHIPFGDGDILVYRVMYRQPEWDPLIITTTIGWWFGSFEPVTWFMGLFLGYPFVNECRSWDYRQFTIDTTGCVLETTMDTRQTPCQLYPAYIPQSPVVRLNNKEWKVTRVMDTVILDTKTRAFEIERDGLRRIITERFGEVAMLDSYDDILMELTSAVIRDTLFNRDTTRRLYLPLCIGNRYQFHHLKGAPQALDRMELSIVDRDTLIDGMRFFNIAGQGPLLGLYACDSSGVYHHRRGETIQLIAGNGSLGTWSDVGTITDTASVLPFPDSDDIVFRSICSSPIPDHAPPYWIAWLDGIGLQQLHSRGYVSGSESYTLTWASVCGKEYGTLVSVGETAGPPDRMQITSVHPHPVRSESTINFLLPSPGSATLELFDMLGRSMRVLAQGDFTAGVQQAPLRTEGLIPGMYFCVLRSTDATTVKQIIIAR